MSREEEETSYSNESHMELLSASEEECAMVAQDRSSNRSLLSSGGLMADVPCLDHSLDGC